ncbi:EamA family transporter [Flavobacterium sp. '19STA2R22 D10 B1']|uniref:EamA family transporter n=1 Tax=Flavobacterium aerium TaxID=3037261 RepID=UPI00278C1F4C|nr:EamA family transporter [Flavobacterium sp. '19STA2R22 D10 B1']
MALYKNSLLVFLAFASIYIIWGSTFLAIFYGLQGFPPFILSGFRFLIAGLILFAWRYAKGEKVLSLPNWKKNAITGSLILAGGTGLVAWGEQYVTSTEAAIAIATGPFWFIAIDKKNWNYYFSNKYIVLGLAIGFSGLLLFLKGSVSSVSVKADSSTRIIAFVVLALSSVSWVLGALYSKNNPAGHSTFMNIAQQLIVAGTVSFSIALIRGEWSSIHFAEVPIKAWAGLGFLIVFGSIIAYLSFIWLLSIKDTVTVSTHTYINPIVAVLLGWIIAGESITSTQFIGLGIILAGVLFTNISKYKIKLDKRTKVKLRRINRFLTKISRPYKHITTS